MLVGMGMDLPRDEKNSLHGFLLEHGPTTRADIAANSILPDGTVSFCLSDKRFFFPDGRWKVGSHCVF